MNDVCASRHLGSPESELANARVESSKAELRYRIVKWFFEHGPATCEEAHRGMEIRYSTMSARISELKADGLLAATGERRCTSGGSPAAVLKAVLRGASTPTQQSLFGRNF
jgi:hypothetical protein